MTPQPSCYGLVAEFTEPNELITAVTRAREAGYRRMDAYTPYPIEEVAEALGLHHSRLPVLVFCGGVLGLLAGFGLQYWVTHVAYPLNIGGRPAFSWPSFIPIMFECTVLFAAFAAVLGMLGLNGLPLPYHPIFNVPRFKLASRDRFFLCIEATDPLFDRDGTRRFLERSVPRTIVEVDH